MHKPNNSKKNEEALSSPHGGCVWCVTYFQKHVFELIKNVNWILFAYLFACLLVRMMFLCIIFINQSKIWLANCVSTLVFALLIPMQFNYMPSVADMAVDYAVLYVSWTLSHPIPLSRSLLFSSSFALFCIYIPSVFTHFALYSHSILG